MRGAVEQEPERGPARQIDAHYTLSKNDNMAGFKRRAGSTGSTNLATSAAAAAALSRTDLDFAASLRVNRSVSSRTGIEKAASLPGDRSALSRTSVDHTATFDGRFSAVSRTGSGRAAPFVQESDAPPLAGVDRALAFRGDGSAAVPRTVNDRAASFVDGFHGVSRTGGDRPASYRSECFGGSDRFSGGDPGEGFGPRVSADASGSGFTGVRRNICHSLREGAGSLVSQAAQFRAAEFRAAERAAQLGAVAVSGDGVDYSSAVRVVTRTAEDIRAASMAETGGVRNVGVRGIGQVQQEAKVERGAGRAGAAEEDDPLFYLPKVDVRDMGVSEHSGQQ